MSPRGTPTTPYVDSHCHIAHIDTSPEQVVADAAEAGVGAIVDIGMGAEESTAAAQRATDLAPHVYATVGVHPNDLESFEAAPDETIATLRALAGRARVVGIGETGLDHFRDRSTPELQEVAFRAQVDLARETDLALVVHCRDAHARLLELLDEVGPPSRVIMHCFSGDRAFARDCADRGFFCSFAGNITYKRSEELRAAARSLPGELVLVETDAPFLAPEGHRGKPNHPALLPLTVAALAEARSMPLRPLAEVLRQNTVRAFALPEQ